MLDFYQTDNICMKPPENPPLKSNIFGIYKKGKNKNIFVRLTFFIRKTVKIGQTKRMNISSLSCKIVSRIKGRKKTTFD